MDPRHKALIWIKQCDFVSILFTRRGAARQRAPHGGLRHQAVHEASGAVRPRWFG